MSVLQGIKDKVGSSAEVLYSEGCKITETDPDWNADKVVLGDPALNAKRIEEAVKVAQQADVVILAIGGNEQTSREAWAANHPGDRDNLDLLGNQDDLVKAILATGKPTIVFLQHGRPNSINYVAENVPAILDGWYLGQEGGTAIADVIFGDYNPAGSCRSPCRDRWGNCRTTTIRSRRRSVNISARRRCHCFPLAGD